MNTGNSKKVGVVMVWVALNAGACGGASGFQQAALRQGAAGQAQAPVVNDGDVGAALALTAQLPRPYRLGVYFRQPPLDVDHRTWRWEPEHKRAIVSLAERLQGNGEVGQVFSIGEATVVGDDLRAIRVAAARHGADAVLVMSGGDEAERYPNAWATTYVAVLPIFFAPAAELDVRFVVHAEMWDVRNEYLYLAAEAESDTHQKRALPWIDREEATARAQGEAVRLLRTELDRRFATLHALPSGG